MNASEGYYAERAGSAPLRDLLKGMVLLSMSSVAFS